MLEDYHLLRNRDTAARVDIGPLLDMVFILLIFFVITTNFSRQTGLEVQKPKAQSALYQGQKTILVGISREGAIHIHGRQVGVDGLARILAREVSRRPDANVVIVGDRGSTLGRAVEVMDACALAGVQKVSVAADKVQ
ncbi:MAG: biopolymer transporter ExbD [Chitinivibrionales bacterium]|nr:biopolymer transporter ExbD [Chitinivibrionales bacterium]